MIKRYGYSILCLSLLCLYGCASNTTKDKDMAKADIVMITDVGTIDDKSFNQGTWEGVKAHGKKTNKTVKYIKPIEKSTNAYNEAIDQAVNKYKAQVVVTPGYLFETSVYEKQNTYPNVKFILVDGTPNDGAQENPTYKTAQNTIGIKYSEEQAGYLAGYAVVKDGKTKLGFMGGIAVPAVKNFGYGFIQGANEAAMELDRSIAIKYTYTNTFTPSAEIQSEAASWYKSGTEVIFACGGGIGNSIMAAAESNKGYVIGVDIDQSKESKTVITSAFKELATSVEQQLDTIDNGEFAGGQTVVLGVKEHAVGLPMNVSIFSNFTDKDYKTIYERLQRNEVRIYTSTEYKEPRDIPLKSIKLSSV